MMYNAQYYDNVDLQISVTASCSELQDISTGIVASVGQTVSALNSQLALVTIDYNALAASIVALENQIATMAASQAAFSATSIQAATVSAVVDLPSVIAYLNAQATVMISLGDSNVLTFIKQLITLEQDLVNVRTAYYRLENQITSLEALLVAIPARLATIVNNIATKAATFPNCTIS